MRFPLSLGTVLGAAALVFAVGCGSVVVDNSSAGPGGSGQAGAGATGGSAGTGGDAGTAGSAQTTATTTTGGGDTCGGGVKVMENAFGDEPCACEGAFSVQLESSCGLTALTAPYRTGEAYCDVQVPYAVGNECKGKYFTVWVMACAAPGTSPCVTLSVSVAPDGNSSSGVWIDGGGTQWTLVDVEMPGAIPWSDKILKGAFSATAVHPDGTSQPIKGEYNVCFTGASVCPI